MGAVAAAGHDHPVEIVFLDGGFDLLQSFREAAVADFLGMGDMGEFR